MRLWSEITAKLKPYTPGEQPKDREFIKLNTNENPYPPSDIVLKAISDAVDERLKLYPDPEGSELKEAIADFYGVDKANVFVGNGSDEVLAMTFMAYFDEGDKLLTPDITYTFYKVYASLFHVALQAIPLNDDFTVPINRFIGDSSAVILANPNAPTAIAQPVQQIERIIASHQDRVVIIDEAYVDFGAESCVPLIHQYDNLLVVHTMSKSRSLAGLRIGFAIGNAQLIEGLNRVKNSFNSYTLDRLALVGATAAMKDKESWNVIRQKIIATREKTKKQLIELGFKVTDSAANFLFIRHPSYSGVKLLGYLRDCGILVRHFSLPRIDEYVRISIGTDEEMDQLINALAKSFSM